MKTCYVYIMASCSRVLYVGVTSDLERRVYEHKNGTQKGFTKRYQVNRLVYFEEFQYIEEAILREKEIKGWRREKKTKLIERQNPYWKDHAEDWFKD